MAWSELRRGLFQWVQGFKRSAYLIVAVTLTATVYGQTSTTGSQQISSTTGNTNSGNYKPAPKRVNTEDIQRMLNSKRPPAPICNAVAASCNPIPQLIALSPSGNIAPGSAAFTLVVIGDNFVRGAVVQWNFNPLATTFVSSTQLTATVTPDLVVAPTVANVDVFNPTPGGGFSAAHKVSNRRVQP
jgi:hypothetical protein